MKEAKRIDEVEIVKDIMDKMIEGAPSELRDVLFEAKQDKLGKAIVADIIDAIPIVGDISNIFRVRDAALKKVERERRITRQLLDMVVGMAPDPWGGILDLITPTNTITYIREMK